MHSGDRTILLDTGSDMHQHWMSASMAIEDLFACQGALHGPTSHHREFANHDFVIERIAFTAETASIRCGDYADVAGGQLQDLCQRAVNVMRRLSRTPKRQLAVRIEAGYRGVLLHRDRKSVV